MFMVTISGYKFHKSEVSFGLSVQRTNVRSTWHRCKSHPPCREAGPKFLFTVPNVGRVWWFYAPNPDVQHLLLPHPIITSSWRYLFCNHWQTFGFLQALILGHCNFSRFEGAGPARLCIISLLSGPFFKSDFEVLSRRDKKNYSTRRVQREFRIWNWRRVELV